MRIGVDRDRCEGLGICEAMAPEFFEVQDDGTMRVLNGHPDDEHRTSLQAAVDSCPMLALRLDG